MPPASASIAGCWQRDADDAAWKELCYLWSSDFRTHITETRWDVILRTTCASRRKCGCGDRRRLPRLPAPRESSDDAPHRHSTRRICGTAGPPPWPGHRQAARSRGHAAAAIGGIAARHLRRHRASGRLVHRRLRVRGAGRAQGHGSGMVRGAQSGARRRRRVRIRQDRDAARARSKRRMRFHADAPRVDFDIDFRLAAIGAEAACAWATSRCCRMRSTGNSFP